ncbi:MAG: hypothetical protein M3066_09705 [Actinomycetota bacterium]|nr:hypothetical protein [Actinomycetota bacterium]
MLIAQALLCDGRSPHTFSLDDASGPDPSLAGVAVELVHELPVHCPSSIERLGEFPHLDFELRDAPGLPVVLGLKLGGALFELIEERAEGFSASDVGDTAQVAAKPFAGAP